MSGFQSRTSRVPSLGRAAGISAGTARRLLGMFVRIAQDLRGAAAEWLAAVAPEARPRRPRATIHVLKFGAIKHSAPPA